MKFELTKRESFIVKNSISFLENYREVSEGNYYLKNDTVFSFRKNKNREALNFLSLSFSMIEKFLNLNVLELDENSLITYKGILIGECSVITSIAMIKYNNNNLTSNIKNSLFNYSIQYDDRSYNELKDDPKVNMSDLKYMKMVVLYVENLSKLYSEELSTDIVFITSELVDILIMVLRLLINDLSYDDIKELITKINKIEKDLVETYYDTGLVLFPVKNIISELFLKPN